MSRADAFASRSRFCLARSFARRARESVGAVTVGARAVARARATSSEDEGRLNESELRAAVEEAREILREATAMASEQAREELVRGIGISGAGGAAVEVLRVETFLLNKGMREADAGRVARDLYLVDALYQDADLLAVQFDRLERAIGGIGVDVSELVSRWPATVGADIGRATANVMRLRDVFGSERLASMVTDCPRLLLCEDLEDRIERTRACIVKIWSSETPAGTLYAIQEEPNLLFTLCDLPVFAKGMSVDISELPMSVQGACFVVAIARAVSMHRRVLC